MQMKVTYTYARTYYRESIHSFDKLLRSLEIAIDQDAALSIVTVFYSTFWLFGRSCLSTLPFPSTFSCTSFAKSFVPLPVLNSPRQLQLRYVGLGLRSLESHFLLSSSLSELLLLLFHLSGLSMAE